MLSQATSARPASSLPPAESRCENDRIELEGLEAATFRGNVLVLMDPRCLAFLPGSSLKGPFSQILAVLAQGLRRILGVTSISILDPGIRIFLEHLQKGES